MEVVVAVFTTPEKGRSTASAVRKEKPVRTARLPSLCACAPGSMRVSAVAPAAAA